MAQERKTSIPPNAQNSSEECGTVFTLRRRPNRPVSGRILVTIPSNGDNSSRDGRVVVDVLLRITYSRRISYAPNLVGRSLAPAFDEGPYDQRAVVRRTRDAYGVVRGQRRLFDVDLISTCLLPRYRRCRCAGDIDISREFWATVCKTVRPMLSDRSPVMSCLVCLSVCL